MNRDGLADLTQSISVGVGRLRARADIRINLHATVGASLQFGDVDAANELRLHAFPELRGQFVTDR